MPQISPFLVNQWKSSYPCIFVTGGLYIHVASWKQAAKSGQIYRNYAPNFAHYAIPNFPKKSLIMLIIILFMPLIVVILLLQ